MTVASVMDQGTQLILAVTALRGLPVLMAFYASERAPARHKLVALLAYQLIVFGAVSIGSFNVVSMIAAYVYLVPVSALPYLLAKRVSRPVLFVLSFAVFLVVPAWFLPNAGVIALLGWDIAMASYSYCVDAKPNERTPKRYAFFVFVNPTLAYPVRGERVAPARLCAEGTLRMSRGLAALFLSGVVNVLAAALDESSRGRLGMASSAAPTAARVVSIYLAHTGLAALQIGLMRMLGYVVPERYDRVLSARSPVEFWTRWNTYVGAWARLYLFMPIVRSLRKAAPRARTFAHGAAILAAFVAMGVIHDIYALADREAGARSITPWFAANGVLLILWHWAGQRIRVRQRRDDLPLAFASTATFVAVVALFATQLP